ncbi:TonB-dependent receptor [soil metagenome]
MNMLMKNQLQVLCTMMCLLLWLTTGTAKAQLFASTNELAKNNNKDQQTEQKNLKNVLSELEHKYNVSILFRTDLDEKISISSEDRFLSTLENELNHILLPNGFLFEKVKEDFYVVKKSTEERHQIVKIENNRSNTDIFKRSEYLNIDRIASKNSNIIRELQQFAVSGTVTSAEDNESIPGVNVLVRGTSIGAITDINGAYTINAPDGNATLVFTYVGFESQEVPINGRSTINVSINPDLRQLQEVVVVGYGSVRKSDLTGSVSSVSEKEIREVPVASLDHALQGRAPGVQVTQNNSAPGGSVSVRVRGGNSVVSGNEPLYVIDGFPIYPNDGNFNVGGFGQRVGGGALNTINPNDIESIEILKDASATAIYGSRGANGVVLITTKSGKEGTVQVNYDGYYGVQEVARKIPMLNATEYAEIFNEAEVNAGNDPLFGAGDPAFPAPSTLGKGTNWQDEIFRAAPMQNHQLTFSGGTAATRYSFSANYFDQQGIVIGSRFQRGSTRLNIDSKVNDRMTIGTRVTYSKVFDQGASASFDGGLSGDAVTNSLTFPPVDNIYRADGSYQLTSRILAAGRGSTNLQNPVALVDGYKDLRIQDRLLANAFAEYEFIPRLKLRVSFGTDLFNATGNVYRNQRGSEAGRASGGIASKSYRNVTNWLNENILSYNTTLNTIHRFDVVAGFTYQQELSNGFSASSRNFVNDINMDHNLGAGAEFLRPGSFQNGWNIASLLGRINYTLLDRYLFTVTGRRDGSSRFGVNNKWANFPSVAFAWRAIEEPFIQGQKLFSDLKLRTSWGITGNQEIGNYRSLARLQGQNYVFNNNFVVGLGTDGVPNPDLRWETTTMTNIGLDFAFMANRLRFTIDGYYNKTTDLLLNVTLPTTTGATNALQNVGSLENKGLEFAVAFDIFDRDFTWTIDANISGNRNKILDIGPLQPFQIGGNVSAHLSSAGSWIIPGQPIGVWYDLEYAGVYQPEDFNPDGTAAEGVVLRLGNEGPGWAKYVDQNGDGMINSEDRVVIGNPTPNFFYGINNRMAYKNFELSFFIQGVYGNDVKNSQRFEVANGNPGTNLTRHYADNRWSPQNPQGTLPLVRFDGNGTVNNSSINIEDGTFVRLRNVMLAYSLPSNVPILRNARVYISGQNLITLTNYTGFDPEVNVLGQNNVNLGNDYGAFPRARTYMIGAAIGF